MFSESKTEARPKPEIRAHCRAKSAVVESFDFEAERKSKARPDAPTLRATPTKKKPRS